MNLLVGYDSDSSVIVPEMLRYISFFLRSLLGLVFSNKRIKTFSSFIQGLMEHPKEIVDYFNCRGVSVIFLFRRNLLRRMVSTLANSYDRYAKLLNGTHKSHVHSTEEVSFPIMLSFIYLFFIPPESSASGGCAVCVSVVNHRELSLISNN